MSLARLCRAMSYVWVTQATQTLTSTHFDPEIFP